MRLALGDGYTEILRRTHSDVPEKSDFVMYWWNKAASLVRQGMVKRFGLITTNSIMHVLNREVIARHRREGLCILFAVPDHPWVDVVEGAAVRVSMTVATNGKCLGKLSRIESERAHDSGEADVSFAISFGVIHDDLTIGANVSSVAPLASNAKISAMGVIVLGEGFMLNDDDRKRLLTDEPSALRFIRPYLNGKDVVGKTRGLHILDLYGLTEESLRRYPVIYQRIYDRVRPLRLEMKDKARRDNWWLFGRSNEDMRNALKGLRRFIATTETSKHRTFVFIDGAVLPDQKLRVVGSDDGWILGVLSSRSHLVWALAAGARLGVGNDPIWTNTTCFYPFPFPTATDAQKQKIRELGEQLDAHRKRQQAAHPSLTMTGMYNVLEKLRSGEPLSAKEQTIHEQGLVSVLKQIHDELDAAVFEAYGWPASLSDEEILERLVALNAERAAEESRGLVRWLRPEYQNPPKPTQKTFLPADDEEEEPTTKKGKRKATKPEKPAAIKPAKKSPWPKSLPEQVQAVRQQLLTAAQPVTADELAKQFLRGNSDRIDEVLQSLVITGNARALDDGERYVAA